MEKLKYFFYINKRKIIIFTCFSIFAIACVFLILINNKYSASEVIIEDETEDLTITKEETVPNKSNTIKVDVKGFVNQEGVYELSIDARVIDAINAAGGFKSEAYTRHINLAKKLVDENVIIVNSIDEINEMKSENTKIVNVCEKTNDACVCNKDIITNTDITKKNKKTNESKEDKININTASVEELTSVNGIGESKAKSIIEYREKNGLFTNIEDVLNVSGIGETLYEKIKDYIKV